MKRRLKRILVLIVLLPMMVLSSCIRIPVSSSSTPPSPTVSMETAFPDASPEASPTPTDWHSGIKTDYSGLTPYQPPEEKYTRLSEGAMPELKPSDGYGLLMPYVGELMYADGGWFSDRIYGLITTSGMIVTDPVYSGAYQGAYYSYSTNKSVYMPVYSLTKMADNIDKNDPWDSIRYAVCALDGSWITPFEYKSVYFYDKAMMLVRDYAKNNVDVMDYNGKVLYNTTSLSCYNALAVGSAYNYGEGIIAAALTSGGTVFIDLLTGTETFTDYTQCTIFSNGLAAVMQDGLYGYIKKDFSMAIPPQFSWADFFINGKSVVQYPDSSFAVIDQDGNVLLKNQYTISRWDSSSYGLYDHDNHVVYYDADLNMISDGSKEANPAFNGWFWYPEGSGVTVFKGNEKHTYKNLTGVNAIIGGFVTVNRNDSSTWQEGLLTLEGDVVIPMTESLSISVAISEKTGKVFAITGTYDRNQSFAVYDSGGEILFSGSGYANFNTVFDLFEVYNDLSYTCIDTEGEVVFRISLMQYVPD